MAKPDSAPERIAKPEEPSDLGQVLIDQAQALERGEAAFLEALFEFDASAGFEAWGHLSSVDWLVGVVKMARSTAFDKLRVARELKSRPVLASAYRDGKVSYSALRAMARASGASEEVDRALVALAEAGTVKDVESAVRAYQLYRDQELAPGEGPLPRRGLRMRPTPFGLVRLEGYLTDAEAELLETTLGAVIEEEGRGGPWSGDAGEQGAGPRGEDRREGDASLEDGALPCIQSSREDRGAAKEAGPEGIGPRDWLAAYDLYSQGAAERNADALMDLVSLARSELARGQVLLPDACLVHVVVGPDHTATLSGGAPLPSPVAQALACEASVIAHYQDSSGRTMTLGRRHRSWTRAQQRAALVRDGGRCRFPGCGRRVTHLHHLLPWAAGGPTDLHRGASLCAHHHTLVHEGAYLISGSADGELGFYRPDGHPIGVSRPVPRTRPGTTDPVGPLGTPSTGGTPAPSGSA